MVTAASSPILKLIRRAVGDQRAQELPDPELLQRFHAQHDQAAFHALLLRHAPMVLEVCRGVLGNEADAEDAFQATFLILAKKAGSIRKAASLGSWLHGVAYRTALKARAQSAARQEHEARVPPRQASELDDLSWREVRQVLHEELSRLPERYRALLVLCYLEGATQEAAAVQLGVARSTLRERLERGRALLRARLVRRGLGPAAVLVATAWPAANVLAGVQLSLMVSTAKVASLFAAGQAAAAGAISPRVVALTEGVLKAMLTSKIKTATAVVLLAVVVCCGIAAALAAQPTLDDRPPAEPPPKKADAAADPLPPGAIARLGSTRLRHASCVTAVAFSPDGKRIASTGWDWQPRVWDTETGEQVYRLEGHKGLTWCVAFSPDGKRLVAGGGFADPTVHVWDLGNGKEIWAAKAHEGPVCGVAFAADGKSVVSVGGDATVAVWDAATGKEVRRLRGHVGEVRGLAVAPGGKLIASAGADRTVRLWDLAAGKEVRKLEGHQTPALAVAFSADGKNLISSGTGEVIRWDPATGKELVAIRGHQGQDRCVAVAPDGKAVVTANQTGALTLWDEAGKELRRIAANPDQWAVAFSPNGKLLASGGADCRVRVWDPATGKEVRQFAGHDNMVTAVACSPDGKLIATSSLDQTVRLWDRATGKEVRRLAGHEGGVLAIAFAPDGKRVASGGNDKVVRLCDAETGKEVARLAGHAGAVLSLAFSPDGKTLATGGGDATVRLWDLAAGKEVHRWTGQKAEEKRAVEAVAFSPDGKLLASAGHDLVVHLWDVASKREVHQLAGHKRVVLRVAFSRDGKSLGSAGGDGKVVLWEVATGKVRAEYGPHYKEDAYSYTLATFTPDGRYFSTANRNRIRVWDPATGKEVHAFAGHQGWLRSMVVTPDGGTLISGSQDTTVMLWDLAGALKGQPQLPALGDDSLKRLWADLANEDAKRSFRAVARLATAPRPAMQLLQAELRPVPPPDEAKAKEIARLIAQLDSEKFNVREKATEELEKLGSTAEPALRKVLEGDSSAEVRLRVQVLLGKLEGMLQTADQLRTQRALEVLGRLGTPEARKLLEALADGAPGARLTAEARAMLRSLDGKPGAP